jgi:hypothetical protein
VHNTVLLTVVIYGKARFVFEATVDQEMKGEAEDTGAASASNEATERRPKVSLESTASVPNNSIISIQL